MLIIKEFEDKDNFYRFLKDRIGIFFREAEQRSYEGVHRVIYLERKDVEPSRFFECARQAGVHAFFNEGKFALSGTEAQVRQFCGCISKYHKEFAMQVLESLIKYRKKSFKLEYNYKVLPLGIKTAIMGVLNVTPDSFSDGGLFFETSSAVKRAVQMAEEGADIIDIGGESTRPGSERISEEEELRRVLPVLKEVRKELPKVWVSVDTYKARVAEVCLNEGADIINDISGGTFDERMFEVVSKYNCPYVLNHIKGRPEEWRSMPIIYEDVVNESIQWLWERINLLKGQDYKGQLIIDPGIGFGKLPEHNVEILKRFNEYKIFGTPLMVGVSRKSFIGLVLEGLLKRKTEPKERIYASLGALALAVAKGAKIVRVHDVKETREFLALLDTVRTYGDF